MHSRSGVLTRQMLKQAIATVCARLWRPVRAQSRCSSAPCLAIMKTMLSGTLECATNGCPSGTRSSHMHAGTDGTMFARLPSKPACELAMLSEHACVGTGKRLSCTFLYQERAGCVGKAFSCVLMLELPFDVVILAFCAGCLFVRVARFG